MSKNYDESMLYMDDNKGSFNGILGAFLGAIVGAIPWVLCFIFLDMFSAWLGFLIGICSLYGYKLMGGIKDERKATLTTLFSSVIAILIATIVSYLIVLSNRQDFIDDAYILGVPVIKLAWDALLYKENLPIILPNLGLSLLLGTLGVLFTKKSILKYADPDKYEEKYVNQAENIPNEVVTTDESNFIVKEKKGTIIALYICSILFIIFSIGWLAMGIVLLIDSPEDFGLSIFLILTAVAFTTGAIAMVSHKRRAIVVRGENFEVTPVWGKTKYFKVDDIHFVKFGVNGYKAVDIYGKLLFRFENNEDNWQALVRYLRYYGKLQ